jgi:hypothetical protein
MLMYAVSAHDERTAVCTELNTEKMHPAVGAGGGGGRGRSGVVE